MTEKIDVRFKDYVSGEVSAIDISYSKRRKIYGVLDSLGTLPHVTVENTDGNFVALSVQCKYVFVPNFTFEWCFRNEHYRVYIHIASTLSEKEKAGYSIMAIGSRMAAAAFVMMYSTIHKYRASRKE